MIPKQLAQKKENGQFGWEHCYQTITWSLPYTPENTEHIVLISVGLGRMFWIINNQNGQERLEFLQKMSLKDRTGDCIGKIKKKEKKKNEKKMEKRRKKNHKTYQVAQIVFTTKSSLVSSTPEALLAHETGEVV